MLKRIDTLSEFSKFVPAICKMHADFAQKWNKVSDQDEQGFLSELVSNFSGKSMFFGSLSAEGIMEYLIIMYHHDSENCLFRIFYVDKTKHESTREILDELRALLKSLGYKNCYFTTTRITRSYDRWVRKLGAKPCEITYNVSIT